VDARDVARGALAAEERGRTGERYLLGGTWQAVAETASVVAELTGRRVPRMVTPMWLARATAPLMVGYARVVGRPALFTSDSLHALRNHRHVSCAKAERELGFTHRPLRESLADTIDWFTRTGMLA
jgi:dihydroflavonol-4-reductase